MSNLVDGALGWRLSQQARSGGLSSFSSTRLDEAVPHPADVLAEQHGTELLSPGGWVPSPELWGEEPAG